MHGSYLKLPQIVCEQPAIDGWSLAAVTKQEVSCCKCFHLSNLGLPTLHSGHSPSWSARGHSVFGKYLCAFKIYGIWPQANRHTHASCNAVPLVWGSLRLAPINPLQDRVRVAFSKPVHAARARGGPPGANHGPKPSSCHVHSTMWVTPHLSLFHPFCWCRTCASMQRLSFCTVHSMM